MTESHHEDESTNKSTVTGEAKSFGLPWQSLMCIGIVCLVAVGILIQKIRHDDAIRQSRINLKQMGIAFYMYHDTYDRLPAGGTFDSNGTGFLGWQVALLPFLIKDPLYMRIDQKLAWDNSPNAALFRELYPAFINPSASETKDLQSFSLSHYSANSHLFYKNSSTKFSDITDGIGTTIMVGEIAAGFPPYAAPGNWRDPALGIHYDEKTFGRPTRDGVSFLMADGAVRLVSDKIAPEVLRALATPAGGEEVDTHDLPDW